MAINLVLYTITMHAFDPLKSHLKPGGCARVCSLERQGGVQVRRRGHHCKSQRLLFIVTLYSGCAQAPSSAEQGASVVGPGGRLT